MAKSKTKYKNVDEQIKELQFEDIVILTDPHPLTCINKYHLIIRPKEGYGIYRAISSINVWDNTPIPDKELLAYIEAARRFFNKVKLHYIMRQQIINFLYGETSYTYEELNKMSNKELDKLAQKWRPVEY